MASCARIYSSGVVQLRRREYTAYRSALMVRAFATGWTRARWRCAASASEAEMGGGVEVISPIITPSCRPRALLLHALEKGLVLGRMVLRAIVHGLVRVWSRTHP